MLARSKLNSTGSKISEALMNNEISHKDFMTIINDKKILRIKRKHQNDEQSKNDVEKINLIEEGKKGIYEVIKRNKIINNTLKP